MKERPILFRGAMVRAILDGTKTQTRRAVRPQPSESSDTAILGSDAIWRFSHPTFRGPVSHAADDVRCPYGQPGDRLWVRETFVKTDSQARKLAATDYRATYMYGDELGDALAGIKKRWTPAIHMPKASSRIQLEVTYVRVERLNDCIEADALAEGITGPHYVGYPAFRSPSDSTSSYRSATAAYEALWEQINGAGSWAANPWVWVIEFQRIGQ